MAWTIPGRTTFAAGTGRTALLRESGDKPGPGGPGAPLTTVLQEGRSRRAAAAGIAGDGRESACSASFPPRRGAVAPARRGSLLLRVAWVKKREQPSRAWIRSLRDLGAEKGRAVTQLASAIPGYAGPGASGLVGYTAAAGAHRMRAGRVGEVAAECPEGQQL